MPHHLLLSVLIFARTGTSYPKYWLVETKENNKIISPKNEAGHDYVANGDEDCITESGSSTNMPCIFPFKFRNITYEGCITDDYDFKQPWCSTKVDMTGAHIGRKGHWGNCGPQCPIVQLVLPVEQETANTGGKEIKQLDSHNHRQETVRPQHKGFDYFHHEHHYPQQEAVDPHHEKGDISKMMCEKDQECQNVDSAYRCSPYSNTCIESYGPCDDSCDCMNYGGGMKCMNTIGVLGASMVCVKRNTELEGGGESEGKCDKNELTEAEKQVLQALKEPDGDYEDENVHRESGTLKMMSRN